jgi:drug/metabolite transporter (DMT)-like permease
MYEYGTWVGNDTMFGMAAVVAIVLLARRLGHDWRPAGRMLGVAAMVLGVLIITGVWGDDFRLAASRLAAVCVPLGWLATAVAAMIVGHTRD